MSKVIWFTGISGAGKTTLAELVKQEFESRKLPIVLLDGDVVRDFFENDLGYSRLDRIQNVKRIAFAANLLALKGINVIVANIAPYYEVRDFIRRKLEDRYIQIFINSSVESVTVRDIKGYYKKIAEGKMDNLIGVDDAYDLPRNPDLVIDTNNSQVSESCQIICRFLKEKKNYLRNFYV